MEQQTPDYVAEGCSAICEQLNSKIESRKPLGITAGHIALKANMIDEQDANLTGEIKEV